MTTQRPPLVEILAEIPDLRHEQGIKKGVPPGRVALSVRQFGERNANSKAANLYVWAGSKTPNA
jgi:hypothetical protein